MGNTSFTDVVWGPVTVALAAAVLAIASATAGDHRPWPWIVGSAGFIVVHTAVNAARDQSIVRRLGRDYDRVQRRAVQVVSDLGQLAAEKYDLWMVDLYVPASRWSLRRQWPFVTRSRELRRELSVALIDARPQPPVVDIAAGPHGECFTSGEPLMWFDPGQHAASHNNRWPQYDNDVNAKLASIYGVLSLTPVVDQLGKNCNGVLAVHVQPEGDIAVQAMGVLRSQEGLHRLQNACIELNGLLAR
jgi:hypothetical protein